MFWKHRYLTWSWYTLALAVLGLTSGWKSIRLCQVTTEPIQDLLLQVVPIRCPNSQPSMVKNRKELPNFWDIYLRDPQNKNSTRIIFLNAYLHMTLEINYVMVKLFAHKTIAKCFFAKLAKLPCLYLAQKWWREIHNFQKYK